MHRLHSCRVKTRRAGSTRSPKRWILAIAAVIAAGFGLNSATSAQDAEQEPPKAIDLQKLGSAAVQTITQPTPMDEDVQDVVFLGDHRPVKMRFHLQVGSEAYLARWKKFIGEFFADLDTDGNGQLTLEEAKPVLTAGNTARVRYAGMPQQSSDPKLSSAAEKQLEAGPMSVEDFTAAMRQSFLPVVAGTSAASDLRGNDQVIGAVDTNGDKVLDSEELAAVRKNLLTLDANDDEIVGSNELTGASTPGLVTFGGGGPQFDSGLTSRLMTMSSSADANKIAKALVERYDTGDDNDGRLTAAEVDLGSRFASHDKDGDGALDLTELVAYVEADQPDLEVIAKMGSQAPQGRFQLPGADDEDEDEDGENSEDKPPRSVQRVNLNDLPKDVQDAINEAREKAEKEGKPFELPEIAKKALKEARMKKDDDQDKDDDEEEPPAGVNVSVDPSQFGQPGRRVWHLVKSTTHDPELHANVEETPDGLLIDMGRFRLEFAGESNSGASFRIASLEEQQFSAMDQDNNKYLDEKEAGQYGPSFGLMDENDDGMIFLKEFKTFLAKQKAAAESQLIATVEDHGHQLFKLLDSNGDDRLSLREIYYAQQRLQEADTDGDGQLALSEIPHNYELTLSRGAAGATGFFAVAITNSTMTQSPKEDVGPAWFSRMDKNGDGDISRREFLGGAEDFQRIDADGDELIDPEEAEAAAGDN